jgi:hypothetical protein
MDYRQKTITQKINISELRNYIGGASNPNYTIAGKVTYQIRSGSFARPSELSGKPDRDIISLTGIINTEDEYQRRRGVFNSRAIIGR